MGDREEWTEEVQRRRWSGLAPFEATVKGDRKGGRVAHMALVRVQTRNDDEA